MKSTRQLSHRLASQWQSADHREDRLLSSLNWPIRLAIGKPNAKMFVAQPAQVRCHLADWRKQKIGRVEWQTVKYQSASKPVDMPAYWLIDKPAEWIAAADDRKTNLEFENLCRVIDSTDAIFHQFIVRRRRLWADTDPEGKDSLIRCCQLTLQLESGMAMGRPLRVISISGYDSKFLENQRNLLSQLLNIRFAGALVGETLEAFLGAPEKASTGCWLNPLVRDYSPLNSYESERLS